MRIALRLSVGARVIQLPSGSMPTISECACCEICRISVLRYASGIQSLGSILMSASMRSWNARSSGDISSEVRKRLAPVSTICAYIGVFLLAHATGGDVEKTIHFYNAQRKLCITSGISRQARETTRSRNFPLDTLRAERCASQGKIADRHRLGRCHRTARGRYLAFQSHSPDGSFRR